MTPAVCLREPQVQGISMLPSMMSCPDSIGNESMIPKNVECSDTKAKAIPMLVRKHLAESGILRLAESGQISLKMCSLVGIYDTVGQYILRSVFSEILLRQLAKVRPQSSYRVDSTVFQYNLPIVSKRQLCYWSRDDNLGELMEQHVIPSMQE